MRANDGEGPGIAIVGLSCRFPGEASNPSGFWEMLKSGRNGFSETTDRYNADAFYHPLSGKRQNVIPGKGGYFIKQNPYVFDAGFFNITAAEAVALDPRQRIAMEVAYEALENAGLPLQKVAGTQTACFMGSSMSDYRDAIAGDFPHYPKYHILGVSDEMIANRISHFLDIHGPSATIQTACSSSLVATHLACQSLKSGEADMAIAGGVGLIIGTHGTMHLNNLGFLNPAGHSRSFDADAGGYGRGEGCGVLVMKRMDTALRDGDNIRAVIRGSGVNSDGWTQGVTMPSTEAQAALMRAVYERNGLTFDSTQYVEAHGTGTKAGDPKEMTAIHQTIGKASPSRKRLIVGSVKPNIGHLEAAAGVASIIKGVLSLEHGLIPPNINFSRANSDIPMDEWGIVVPTKLTPWPTTQKKRMSVSGFGMGGTNAHVVIDAFTAPADPQNLTNNISPTRHSRKRLYVFSSKDKAGFKRLGHSLSEHLGNMGSIASTDSYLADFAHTLAVARSGHAWKATCVADNVTELREQLSQSLGDEAVRPSNATPRVGFVFTGQGAQWARMGIELLEKRAFAESVAKSARFLKVLGCSWDPITELERDKTTSRLGVPEVSQPICTVLQIALVDELRSWGLSPCRVVGHSSGEIAAAYTIGALSHCDAIAASYYRGLASSGAEMKQRAGGMMAVGCSRREAQSLMEETGLEVTIACVNSPFNVTLSGDTVTLEALRAILSERKIFARRLKVDVAYHSSHMHACSAEYYESIAHIGQDTMFKPEEHCEATMVSSVTAEQADPELLTPYYWVQNLISPVLFTDAVKEMVAPADANGERIVDFLLEIGPHSALAGPVEQILSSHGINDVYYKSMLVRDRNALDTSLDVAADLLSHGISCSVAKVNGDVGCRLLVDLPTYSWNHNEQFRVESRVQRELSAQKHSTKGLIGAALPRMSETEHVWRGFIRLDEEPWLRSHIVGQTVVFPGAGMISLVLEAANQIADSDKTLSAFRLRDISFLAAMPLPEGLATEVTVHIQPHRLAMAGSTSAAWWEFTVSSCTGTNARLRTNARGLLSMSYEESKSAYMAEEENAIQAARIADYHSLHQKCSNSCSEDSFYENMKRAALLYGEEFRGVQNCHPGRGQSWFDVRLIDAGETFTREKLDRPFLIHTTTLDAILQGWLASTCDENGEFGFDRPMVPSAIGELEVSVSIPGDAGYRLRGACRSLRHGFSEYSADINVLDESLAKVLLSISDFRTAPLEIDDTVEADGGTGLDPAKISAELRWDFAIDTMDCEELSHALLQQKTATVNDCLTKLLQMIVHQHPASTILEVALNPTELPDSATARLPKEMMLPSQVWYAIIDDKVSPQVLTPDDAIPRQLLSVDEFGAFQASTTALDALVIPSSVYDDSSSSKKLTGLIESFADKGHPNASILIGSKHATVGFQSEINSVLTNMGFEINSFHLGETGCILRCRRFDQKKTQALEHGTAQEEVCILEPIAISPEAQSLSKKLQAILKTEGCSVMTETGLPEIAADDRKTWISLLELEQPLLDRLSSTSFQSLQKLMLSCTHMLWITCGDYPAMGIVDGLSRCVNNEVAGGRLKILHLGSEGIQFGAEMVARLFKLRTETVDSEFRGRAGHLQIQRVHRSPIENRNHSHHLTDTTRTVSLQDEKGRFHLEIGKPGLLDSLRFVYDEHSVMPLGENDLELQVKATGVNFRDVMASMGLVPVAGLGQEASGIVLRAGTAATKFFKAGDRVSAISLGGMHATTARCDFRVTAKIPNEMSFTQGAAATAVHVTAYYALVKLAKLRRGQSVLIHAAAGGVGQAAVQLASHLGLEVFVTVGTEDKRHFLMEHYGVPASHIFNSRDASFAKGVQRMTNGRGVDCILNSLSGELLRVSWTCIATFGTFVEIGLRDITDNMRLDMRPFMKNATFTFFDILTLIKEQPVALGEVLGKVSRLLHDGVVRVIHPITVYPAGRVEEAFRFMQQGRHRGKVVLSFSEDNLTEVPVLCRAVDSFKLDPDATYLFVGGLGGLGRSLAQEFVACGARNIAFVSRSGDSSSDARATMQALSAHGANVKAIAADVASQSSFLEAMAECERHLPPMKGVIQMAMILRDGVFESMSYEDWQIPLRPKIQGTWNLHEYFGKERPLDFMVLCSSISGLCGNPGQAQYDAGNTYQDSLAHYRRSKGLKAVSVNLGIMLDVGVIAESVEHNFKTWEQVLGIREPAFHALMKSIINGQRESHPDYQDRTAQVCVGLGTADAIATNRLPNPPWFADPRFGSLAVASTSSLTSGGEGAGATLTSRLTELGNNKDISAATEIITTALVKKTAEVLRIPPSEVDASRPMYSYGVDSLVALEMRNWITREIKANMALLDILAAVPMETFAGQIAQKSKLVVGVT